MEKEGPDLPLQMVPRFSCPIPVLITSLQQVWYFQKQSQEREPFVPMCSVCQPVRGLVNEGHSSLLNEYERDKQYNGKQGLGEAVSENIIYKKIQKHYKQFNKCE